jgi:glycosyltransferase involved in cell wall biosynthesis
VRIVHLIPRFPPAIGGAEAWCAGVARYCAAHGDSLEVLCFNVIAEDEQWDPRPRAPGAVAVGAVDLLPGIRVRRCAPAPPGAYGFQRLAERLGIRVYGRYSSELFGLALAAARRADVVHLHHSTVPLSFWGLLVARLARRPVVITPHFHPGDPVYEQPASRWLLRRCDVVTTDTPHEAVLLAARGISPDRLVVATTAVDVDDDEPLHADYRTRVRTAWGLAPDTRVVTFIGRKSAQKQLPVLVDAVARVRVGLDVVLVLVGPATDWYETARAGLLGRGVRVIDVPAVPEEAKRAVIAASDVVVQPSLREAFGIVFLEAWARGVPVVGADHGAVPTVIGDAGLVFTPGDVSDLSAKLAWLLRHPDEARAMAARGRTRMVREHSWERVGTAVRYAYQRAVGAHPAGSDGHPPS